ncbi:hypothetical protein [Umezawaea tangerina]|uniref:hypothetical protein n=1 Tax=Umezawaea tangerina TaxID=84725 RepID=UPI001472C475|nr:hypothetical protein [Umezawaea tangerina]
MEIDTACDLCDGTGVMTWQQPVPDAGGHVVLRQMSHPCVRGCAGWWKAPAAESGGVVDVGVPDGDGDVRTGNVAEANRLHRTDWSSPVGIEHEDGPATAG